MLRWALMFFILALVAAALGMWRLQGIAMQIAWVLCVVFLVLFIVSMITGRRPRIDV